MFILKDGIESPSIYFGTDIRKWEYQKEDGNYGNMYFTKTLNDWAKFDINKRTLFDAAISSGLAIMACNRNLYAPKQERTTRSLNFGFKKYNNNGTTSKIIQ